MIKGDLSMIYLYVKTHNITGLKYLGKTTQNPFKYKGSGKRWQNHIKKHGYDVTTEIIGEYNTIDELCADSFVISEKYDIVNSNEWANLRPETGDGGDTSEYIDYSKLNRGKGLTYEQRYGEEKAKKLREFRSKTLGKSSSSRKGKTLVELYGEERAAEITKTNRAKSLGRKTPHKSETKLKISAARIGYKNPTFCCLLCKKEMGINNFTQHQNTHSKKEIVLK
jgi:hypothetical protein